MKEEMGFADAKALSREAFGPGSVSTCRFDTRVDYVFVDSTSISNGRCVVRGYDRVTVDGASDHSMVITDLELRRG